jgi:hypothetical protein
VDSGKAEDIVNALINHLQKNKIDIKKLNGIGSDNASTMVGSARGVYEIIKTKFNLPKLVLVRCVCHSLQLALSKATEKSLPRQLKFLVKETYNWFSHSTDRQKKYKEIYRTLNDGEDPLKIPKVCATHWISIEPAINRILSQWMELKTLFEITRLSEHSYTAEVLHSLYNNSTNQLFLIILQPILQRVQETNKLFECDKVDVTKLLDSLRDLLKYLGSKIIIPSAIHNFNFFFWKLKDKLDPNPYFGFAFEKEK